MNNVIKGQEAFHLFFPKTENGKIVATYDEPVRVWQFSVSCGNLPSVWVNNVGFKLTPQVSIEYLGNPQYGKPRRMIKFDSSQLGDLTIECTDEATNRNLRELLGKLESSNNIASGSKPVHELNVVQYIQRANKDNTATLIPYIHYKFAVTLNDLTFSDFSDDNSFSTFHTVMKIDSIGVSAFPDLGVGFTPLGKGN